MILISPYGTYLNVCDAHIVDVAIVNGYIWDLAYDGPAHNYTVKIVSEHYLGNTTVTNSTGYYEMNIPSGNFTLTIYKESTKYTTYDFNIQSGEIKRLDFRIDSRRGLYRVYGYITDIELNIIAVGYTVNITGADDVVYDSTLTDFYGYYELLAPSGQYTLSVSRGSIEYRQIKVTLLDEDKSLDLKIKEVVKKPEGFELINIRQIISDIIDHWYALVLLIALCIIAPVLLTLIDRFFDKIRTKKFKFLDDKSIDFIEKTLRYNIYIAFVIFVIWLLAIIFPGIDRLLWRHIALHIAAIYTIVILAILMKFFLILLKRSMDYLRGDLSIKPKMVLSRKYIAMLEIVLRYAILLFFVVNIIVIALAIFGMGDVIYKAIVGFFAENFGYIIFIIIVIAMVYLGLGFLHTFIEDMKIREAARISPQVVDMIGKTSKIIIYMMGAMLIIFALLQMAKMGELGTTLILMLSMIIGIVVAMAATGSIGNILSGLVLSAFRPFNTGDRVKIGSLPIGDVVDTNLVFVRIRTLENVLMVIPNNKVIADEIVNYSRSTPFAVVVDATIGYDVPVYKVMRMMNEAARRVEGILTEPKPFVSITEFYSHAIGYKLRAFTNQPSAMNRIRSDIMIEMQRVFTENDTEILSPEYEVERQSQLPKPGEVKARMKEIEAEDLARTQNQLPTEQHA
ncbi:MAG: mechanosensitive ion channel domain-containing protein [Candidatus Thermoplasmatota archaeon]